MPNPVMLRVTRGPLVESLHRGAVAAFQGGKTLFAAGDADAPVFLRSSAKPFQAMALLLSGAAEAHGLGDDEIAVACASHGAEEIHLAAVRSLQRKCGVPPEALGCGAHPPASTRASLDLARGGGKPETLHNNCSGKHTAMLAAAKALGAPLEGYLEPDHPVQRMNLRNLALFAGVDPASVVVAVDGCSAPVFAIPLVSAAAAFSRLAAPDATIPPAEAAAARRIVKAMTHRPDLVAWPGRGDAALMGAAPGRIVSKLGAEGVQCLGVLDRGLGIALKLDDGSDRARLPLTAALLEAAGVLTRDNAAAIGPAADRVLRNHRGVEVGRLEPVLPRGWSGALRAANPGR
jgi:L-asparaginase II